MALFVLKSPSFATAAVISPGDIVVDAENGGSVYDVKPSTGAATLISSGGRLFDPNHIVFDPLGRILTAERGGPGVTAGIVRLDPASGNQTLVASGAPLNIPLALGFDQSNNLIVGNSTNQLFRVNPQNGSVTPITTITGIASIQDVDVDQQGRIVVLDFGTFNSGGGKIVRFDPSTGMQTTVSTGLFNPSDLLIRPSGDYIVANRLSNETTQLIQVNPTTGAQQIDLTVPSEGWIALQDPNDIVYADFNDNLSILRANLQTKQTQTISSFHFPTNLVGVAIYVPEPSSAILVAIGFGFLVRAIWRRRSFRQEGVRHYVPVKCLR